VETMTFRGWQKTSLIEYPGRVSTVLFTGGCNFRCPFCYNAELVLSPENLPAIEESEVLRVLKKRRKLYQAVVVTGGEPTLEKGLPLFFSKVKKLGLLTGLETNGTNPGMLRELIRRKLVDFIAMDVKAPLTREKYMKSAGIKDRKLFEGVKKSVRLIIKSGMDYEFRTTVHPRLHKEEDILKIAEQLKGAKKYVIQQFTPRETTIDGSFSETKPYPDGKLLEVKKRIEGVLKSCEVRNIND
jgi:pyruvate formate lyase activating enzyme